MWQLARSLRSLLVLSLAALVLTGCGGGSYNTARPRPALVPLQPADWEKAAYDMAVRIDKSGVLEDYRGPNGEPAVVAIGDFKNLTTVPQFAWDRNFAYRLIEGELINNRIADVNMDVRGTGGQVDELLRNIGDLTESPEYDPSSWAGGAARIPALILWGDINANTFEDRSAGGWVHSYLITFRLLDTAQKTAVLQDSTRLDIPHR